LHLAFCNRQTKRRAKGNAVSKNPSLLYIWTNDRTEDIPPLPFFNSFSIDLGIYMPTDPGDHTTAGGVAGRISVIILLVVLNAIFVAAEYALATNSSEDEDHSQAPTIALRIGSSLASIALGVVAGPIWFAVAAFFHIVLGWLAPSAIAMEHPGLVRRYLGPIAMFFARTISPIVWIVNKTTDGVLRVFGIKNGLGQRPAYTPEELRRLVMNAHAQGELEESDRAMLAGVFDFKQKRAHDVMRPRTEVVAIDIEATEQEVWEIIRTERYSRYPVYRESLDDVVGVFLAKDLWLRDPNEKFELSNFIREALYVPDSRPAERVLDDLRRTRAYMAVVLDEYGGTAGIITVEDLVEEVMGDIADEYDLAARTSLEMNGVLELAGTLSLIDARSDHRLDIPEGDWTTLGGFVFSQLGRLPKVGDRVPFPGGELEVVAMDGRRVAALRVHRGVESSPQQTLAASLSA
jgi:putative hemolysin